MENELNITQLLKIACNDKVREQVQEIEKLRSHVHRLMKINKSLSEKTASLLVIQSGNESRILELEQLLNESKVKVAELEEVQAELAAEKQRQEERCGDWSSMSDMLNDSSLSDVQVSFKVVKQNGTEINIQGVGDMQSIVQQIIQTV